MVDKVAAAMSRDGLRQIDRVDLHRRVEAHESTRGNQHQHSCASHEDARTAAP